MAGDSGGFVTVSVQDTELLESVIGRRSPESRTRGSDSPPTQEAAAR
jgi:hypothetical protein